MEKTWTTSWIDTRFNKDDHDSTIESFKDEIKAEAEEGKLLRY